MSDTVVYSLLLFACLQLKGGTHTTTPKKTPNITPPRPPKKTKRKNTQTKTLCVCWLSLHSTSQYQSLRRRMVRDTDLLHSCLHLIGRRSLCNNYIILVSGTFSWVTHECYASINLSLIYFSLHITSVSSRKGLSIYIYMYIHISVCQISMSFWPEKHNQIFFKCTKRESSSIFIF